METRWSDLPMLVLYQILDELVDIDDRFSFSATCKFWNFAYNSYKELPSSSVPVPMLLISTRRKGKKVHKRFNGESNKVKLLYNLVTGSPSRQRFEIPYRKRFCGSSYGWLATIEEAGQICLVISLINPYHKHYDTIKLPPLKCNRCVYYEYSISKVVLTSDPALHPHDFSVVVCLSASTYGRLAFLKSTQSCWIYIDGDGETEICTEGDGGTGYIKRNGGCPHFTDVLIYKDSVFAIGLWNNIVSFALNDANWPPKVNLISPKILSRCDHPSCAYIVQSSKGEVLLVDRYRDDQAHYSLEKTISFKVFKVTFDAESKKLLNLVEVTNLDGDTIFLGTNSSVAIPASKISGMLKSNSIYFADDYDSIDPKQATGQHDIGVFCLDDQSFGKHYEFYSKSDRFVPPNIWYLPPC